MSDPRIRTLKIKTGVVKRLAKEKVAYEKEVAVQRESIQKLKDQGEDQFSIARFKEKRNGKTRTFAKLAEHVTFKRLNV